MGARNSGGEMDLTIRREDLLSGLALAHMVADRKSTMPVLASVLLSADAAGRLRFNATDLCVSVSARAEATVKRPGAVASHARTLFEIVKNLPDGEVMLTVGRNHALRVQSGTIDFRVPGAPSEEFPTLPSHRGSSFAEIAAGSMAELLARTHYAMSSDETRPHVAGVLFESDGKLARMVATDGHRLSKAEVEADGLEPFAMLLPRRGAEELRRLVKGLADGRKLGVAVVDGTAFFHAVDVLLSVKLSSEQFPPYAKVIPRSSSRRVLVARELLAASLARIGLLAKDRDSGLCFTLGRAGLEIAGESAILGTGREELSVDFTGDKTRVSLHGRYLLDALSALPDGEVALELGGELEPCVVKPTEGSGFVGVIMPMRMASESAR